MTRSAGKQVRTITVGFGFDWMKTWREYLGPSGSEVPANQITL